MSSIIDVEALAAGLLATYPAATLDELLGIAQTTIAEYGLGDADYDVLTGILEDHRESKEENDHEM